ncbi:hypothetical protein AAF712_015875 [Marasmius tenuissimus]|uniref:Uncharacterized protein n=1 Tax=Marasmius tenuissimus TaxID=585030 RepID=A0ABR2Z9A0_9AGAR|nr:hypothetical protein PM082_011437 [Marasmius tenuissimus]
MTIFGLQSDLKRAQQNFVDLSERHSDFIDKSSDEMSAMERQVLDATIENKIIRTARAADRKEWTKRVAALEAKLAEKTAAVNKLTIRVRDAEHKRDEVKKSLGWYRTHLKTLKAQIGLIGE